MVLTKHISAFVQSAAISASGRSTNTAAIPARPMHFTFAPVITGDFDVQKHGQEMYNFLRKKLRSEGWTV